MSKYYIHYEILYWNGYIQVSSYLNPTSFHSLPSFITIVLNPYEQEIQATMKNSMLT